MMGSQPYSCFLGIEALCFIFSFLIFMRASVMCFVKVMFIALALGLLASFCRNLITSEILQPSRSKSKLSSRVVELLLALTLVVVIVETLKFLAISSSLSHLARNSANSLTFSSILTCMALVEEKGLSIVSGLAAILLIKEDCA